MFVLWLHGLVRSRVCSNSFLKFCRFLICNQSCSFSRRFWFAFNLGPEDIYFNAIGGNETSNGDGSEKIFDFFFFFLIHDFLKIHGFLSDCFSDWLTKCTGTK